MWAHVKKFEKLQYFCVVKISKILPVTFLKAPIFNIPPKFDLPGVKCARSSVFKYFLAWGRMLE